MNFRPQIWKKKIPGELMNHKVEVFDIILSHNWKRNSKDFNICLKNSFGPSLIFN